MNEDLESGIEHMEICRPPDSSSRAVHFDADSVQDHQGIIIKIRNALSGEFSHIADVHLGFLKVSRRQIFRPKWIIAPENTSYFNPTLCHYINVFIIQVFHKYEIQFALPVSCLPSSNTSNATFKIVPRLMEPPNIYCR